MLFERTGIRLAVAFVGAALLSASCSSKSGASDKDWLGGFQSSTEPPAGEFGPACVSQEVDAVAGARPVDIIFAIDNSQSMAEEIAEVEAQINVNFANIIDASKTDYRVIMLSNHGGHGSEGPTQKICVKAPLSATDCAPIPAVPAETTKFFHHNVLINSSDTLCQLLQSYNGPDRDGRHPQGWASLLRPGAFKVFAVMTDDQVAAGPCHGWPRFDDRVDDPVSSKTLADTFETALFALNPPHFGSSVRRNYVWHSIVGLSPFDANDTSKPYPPSAPLVANKCTPSAVSPGLGYQALSRLTGGLRYPTCGLDYTTIFKAMASGIVDNAVLPCSYRMPADPVGATIDPTTAVVRYTSGGSVTDFAQVDDASACEPQKFYIENNLIHLCSDACKTVQSDPVARMKVLFSCQPPPTK